MSSRVDFEALGISNPPSWSVQMMDNAGGTKEIQVPRAPVGIVVEGLPLSSYLPVTKAFWLLILSLSEDLNIRKF